MRSKNLSTLCYCHLMHLSHGMERYHCESDFGERDHPQLDHHNIKGKGHPAEAGPDCVIKYDTRALPLDHRKKNLYIYIWDVI